MSATISNLGVLKKPHKNVALEAWISHWKTFSLGFFFLSQNDILITQSSLLSWLYYLKKNFFLATSFGLLPCCQSCGLHWGWTQCSVFLTYIWHQFLFYSEVKPIDNTTKKHDLKRKREHVTLTVIHRRGNRKETYNHSVHACLLSPVRLFVTPWTAACQPPLSTKFFRQEYWSRLPFPTRGDLP